MRRNTFHPRTRAALLGTASALVLSGAIGAASPARAAGTEIDWMLDITSIGWVAVGDVLDNAGPISSAVDNATIETVEVDGAPGAPPSSVSVDGNLIGAFATGNSFSNDVELELISDGVPDIPDATGIAVLSLAINAGSVNSSVTDSTISVLEIGFENGTVENVGNLITAQTTLNRGDTTVHGTVPNGYTDDAEGNIAFDSSKILDPGQTVFASGATIAVTSAQLNTAGASGSQALLDGNAVALTITPNTADQVVNASPLLDDNTLSAVYRGNTATSAVLIEAGADPTFTGSVAVANIQANEDVIVDGWNAENSGSTVSAVVGSTASDGSSSALVGTLSVSGNTISSSAVGNEALGANGGAGNLIALDPGLNFAGSGGDPAGSSLDYTGDQVVADVTADLALLNHQSNVDGPTSSATQDAEVSALVQSLEGGSVDVSGNTIGSRTVGNAASNAILGPGFPVDGTNSFDGTAAVASGQINWTAPVSSLVSGAGISAAIGNTTETGGEDSVLVGGVVALEGNAIRSTAMGNQVANALGISANTVNLGENQALASLTGGMQDDAQASVSGGATILNVQANYSSDIQALTQDASITLDATDLTPGTDIEDSDLAIAGNAIEAVAVGSSAGNTLGIEANSLSGSAGIGNLQVGNAGDGAAVTASVTGASILLSAGAGEVPDLVEAVDVVDSTLAVTGNLIGATAYGTTATNRMLVDANNAVTPNNGIDDDTESQAAAVVNIDLTELAGLGLVFDNDPSALPSVTAAYGILNIQNVGSSVSSSITGGGAQIAIDVGGSVAGSTVLNDGNALVTWAYGNQASSAVDLAFGNLSVEEDGDSTYSPIANVTNVQTLGSGVDISSTITSGGVSIETVVAGDADSSTLSVSDNTVQAVAYGNRASTGGANPVGNSLSVSANSIVVIPSIDEGPLGGLTTTLDLLTGQGDITADAAFSVVNAQSGADSVTATLVDTGALLQVTGDVGGSTLDAVGNAFLATAINNQAVNALSLEANTLAASSGVQSFQLTSSSTRAIVGSPGELPVPPTPAQPFTVDAGLTTLNSSCTGGTCDILGGTVVTIDTTGLTQEQIDALVAVGWVPGAGTLTSSDLSLITALLGFSTFAETTLSTGDTVPANAVVPASGGSDGFHASPSVIIAIGGNSGDIIDSSVTIGDTQTFATAVSNDVANSLSVQATNLEPGAGGIEPGASLGEDGSDIVLSSHADHAVSNLQLIASTQGVTEAAAYSTLGIEINDADGAGFTEISGSSLSIDGNLQQALAIGNRATGEVVLDATNIGTDGENGSTSSLASVQAVSGHDVTAVSESEIFSPAAIATSSLSISGNINSAVATANQASNTTLVSATNIGTSSEEPENASAALDLLTNMPLVGASADHSLLNGQITEGTSVSATASTSIYNQGLVNLLNPVTEFGMANSTANLSDNVTEARAVLNQATNSLTVEAGATQAATGALTNAQFNFGGSATAEATGTIGFALNSDADTTVDSSSISVSDNIVSAAARGNSATNVLNATAGAGYANLSNQGASSSTTGILGSDPTAASSATYAALNAQHNEATVTATVTGGISVSLQGGATNSVSGSSLNVGGNHFEASAVGNAATNLMSASVTPSGGPSMALTSVQRNTGNITATASNVTIGVDIGSAGRAGSTTAVTGNRITASATGNSVVNRLTVGGN